MSSCQEGQRNLYAEIKSKCYDKSPGDRYKIIYSYPPGDVNTFIPNILGDILYFTSGSSGFLVGDNGDEFSSTNVFLNNGDRIILELSPTNVLTITYNPVSGTDDIITLGVPYTNGDGDIFVITYNSPPVVQIVVNDGLASQFYISVNLNTNVITSSPTPP